MKKNTFFLLVGCIALALLAIFWYSVEIHNALLIEIAFIAAIVIIYITRRTVTYRSGYGDTVYSHISPGTYRGPAT
jgi:uncharacterized membrane protein